MADNKNNNEGFIPVHGGYQNLITYQKSEIIYDGTIYFTKRFFHKNDRVRACYQHACLKYVMNEKMTNTTLRERFKIADENAAMVSRIIKDTFEAGFIKEDDPENRSRKYVKYIPVWA